ncbi:MAG TPA: alpha-glucan family phosphorylase [Pyrinomonadaceae bacterium]|jgi:starch phosphorylase|nr:alpha-glucan family phosphorylase [Pyrinomonadaceae bacterium]
MIETSELAKIKTLTTTPTLPTPLQALERLSWNYWWSWSADGAGVYRDLDAELWDECEHNPRVLLERVSDYRLAEMATDPVYVARIRKLAQQFDEYLKPIPDFKFQISDFKSEISGLDSDISNLKSEISNAARGQHGPLTAEHPIAYFCAEYGVHNSLPLYSGGLGVLAGDHLKSASDLNLPLVAVGLLYHYGYFRQRLNLVGWQEEFYGETDPNQLPLVQVIGADGTPLVVEVLIRERMVRAQVWRAEIGRVPLYLLDTNIIENAETDRWVTGHLYGGDRETRIVQEMLLGIGGVRLLRKLEIQPRVYHLNEGHSAFLTLELTRELVQAEGLRFADAAAQVRERCVFTTHTPVAAGNDEFEIDLLTRSFGDSFEKELGLTHDEFVALGRIDPANQREAFGLTPLAIRMSRSTNGVSRKHGEVSRALWQKLWPQAPVEQVPITHVTNGVHAPTWIAPLLRSLFEEHISGNWQTKAQDRAGWRQAVHEIPDEELWAAHLLLKERLVAFIRQRSVVARLNRGESAAATDAAREMFDHRSLTIGFARRAAGYKRWNLVLKDTERLQRITNATDRPVQFVFAGKAHPQDQEAKLILQEVALWGSAGAGNRSVFLQNYDHEIARQLVQSVDVWLNVPRRPLEASGTSGEKVAMNGGLNLSGLDGWWLEGYDGTNGFAVGADTTAIVDDEVDASDAESLYRVLEQQVVPLYYDRDLDGLPHKWIAMMKNSIATLVPEFNSNRMVEEYARRIYM